MRKALNENPVVQLAVVGVLIVIVGFVFMMNMGGGGDDAPAPTTSSSATSSSSGSTAPTVSSTSSSSTPATGAPTPVSSQPLGPEPPAAVRNAFDQGDTIVLLVVEPNGIEDRRVKRSVKAFKDEPGVSVFIVPASQIANYSHLTQGLQVSRVPALIVVSPRRLSGDTPLAQVHYGYLSPDSIRQAVRDAEYEGQPASYGPE